MKPKTIVPLVLGLGVGFFAIKMGIDMAGKAKGSTSETMKVVVAARQIDAATRITDQMLTTRAVPVGLCPPEVFSDAKSIVGRVSKLTVPNGIPVSKAMLAPPGAEPGLRSLIPSGHRAVSVQVNEASAVAGFIQPGSRVDVFSSDRGSSRSAEAARSRLIISDVEVGAVGQSISEVADDGKTARVTKSVTLFLKPEQVPLLHAASTKGNIRLAMRGDGEPKGEPFSWGKLFAALKPEEPPKPQQQVVIAAPRQSGESPHHIVEVLHGTQLERVVFDEKGAIVTGGRADRAVREPAVQRVQPEPSLPDEPDDDDAGDSSTMETLE